MSEPLENIRKRIREIDDQIVQLSGDRLEFVKEIGEIMQISESRVSQIHTKAVWRLRGMISDKFEDLPCN